MRAGCAPAPPARCLGGNRPGGRGALGPIWAPVRARRIRARSTLRLGAANAGRSAAFRTKSLADCEAGARRRSAADRGWRTATPGSARGPVPPTPASSLTGRRSRHAVCPLINNNAPPRRRLVVSVCERAPAARGPSTTPSLSSPTFITALSDAYLVPRADRYAVFWRTAGRALCGVESAIAEEALRGDDEVVRLGSWSGTIRGR